MRAAKKTIESRKILQELVPLNSLSSERFNSLAEKILVEEVRSGSYLFRKGDRDNQTIYLLAGKLNMIDGFRKVSGEIEAGTEASRHPIAAQQPRPYSARATGKAVIARIDSGLLDAFLSWDHASTAELIDIGAEDDGDWMTRLLQSEAFRKLSPSKLQGLLMKMQHFPVSKGQVVVAEGEEGDYFYTIHEGRCAVTRQDKAGGNQQLLAELGPGDSFGEDALVSNQARNATITMLTDGVLMRLAKDDFNDLLKTQLVRHVPFKQAEQMVSEGAGWLDVRSLDEHERSSLAGSINIPFASLRDRLPELSVDSRYIVCCDTGSRSESAAFLLSHKGFDVFVLEKGLPDLLTVENTSPAPAGPAGTGQVAEVVELAAAASGRAGPTHAELAAAEQVARLQADYDALRGRHEELLAEQEQRHAAEASLEEQLGRLREELGGSSTRFGELDAQVNAHAAERQSLLDEYAKLEKTYTERLQSMQLELDRERGKAQQLASQAESTAEECNALRAQVADVEQGTQGKLTRLQEELDRARTRVSEMEAAIQSSNASRSELQKESTSEAEQTRREMQSLQVELGAARSDVERLSAELSERQLQLDNSARIHESRIQELQQKLAHQLADSEQGREQLESLQDELNGTRQDADRLSAELAAVTKERQELAREITTLGREMVALQQAASASNGKLLEEGELAASLRAKNDELIRQAGQLRDELAEREAQLESAVAGNEAQAQELQQQLEQLQSELAERESQLESAAAAHEAQAQELKQELQQLEAVTAEYRQAQATIHTLQEENRQLDMAGKDASREHHVQLKRAEGLLAERNAAAAVYAKQQAKWDEERSALQDRASREQELAARLGKELEQITAAMAEAGADFEQQLQQQIEKAGNEREELEQSLAGLQQAASAVTEELELLKQQYDELVQQSEQSATEKAGLDRKIADKDAQIEAARLELSQYEVDKTVLGEELELSRQQIQELQQALVQYESRVKSLDQELQESTRKAHDDLKRKNENEKELQGRIEQQRKKLDQLTADYKKSLGQAQDNIDYLRDELHAERDARDAERVEMATRQRELKEQLAAAANTQKVDVSEHPEALEEAVDAVRAEERSRLQAVLDAHAETEQQLARVQSELQQAHAELADHHREEKNRRQSDVELMADLNQQAEAAIAQLQDQLQQLTEERDSALEEQQGLHEKMDSLRAEVEAAREMASTSAHGQKEDPVQLRKQLEETRRNVEIAVRLRTEAEAARDRLLEERDRLLAKSDGNQNTADVTAPPAAHVDTRETARPESVAVKPAEGVGQTLRWMKPAIGLLATGVIAVVGWLLLGGMPDPEQVSPITSGEAVTAVEAESVPPVVGSSATETPVQSQPAEHEQPAPIVREKSSTVTAQQASTSKKNVAQDAGGEKQVEAVAGKTPAVAPGPVVRTFSDGLKGGGRGPEMVELAAASFQMGSVGNSINSSEVPRHEVTLPAYSISRNEISFDEYDRYARATGNKLPDDKKWGRGKQPVINVSWDEAEGYVKWLSAQTGKTYRLPSEAQWEYAARGGSDEIHWWIGLHSSIPANCFNCGSQWDGARTAPVGQFASNPFGLNDMAGNVQEWTEDCYHQNYNDAPADGSAWLISGCVERVVRGGAYTSPQDSLRSAKRFRLDPDIRLDNLGFRVVRVN